MTLHNYYLNPESKEWIAILRQIVAIWPKPDGTEPVNYREELAPVLTSDFDQVDFVNKIQEVAEIARVSERPNNVEVQFYDVDGYLHKAVFVLEHGIAWRLQSLRFQCPVCFGSGVNDGERCEICRGTGWGAS
jgi:hypothetical protein